MLFIFIFSGSQIYCHSFFSSGYYLDISTQGDISLFMVSSFKVFSDQICHDYFDCDHDGLCWWYWYRACNNHAFLFQKYAEQFSSYQLLAPAHPITKLETFQMSGYWFRREVKMVIQKPFFAQSLDDYKKGFGAKDLDYWVGLENLPVCTRLEDGR